MNETLPPLPLCLYGLLRDNFYLIFALSFCPNKPLSFSFWRFFIDGWTQFFPICRKTVSCHADFRKKRKHPSNQIIFREISGLSFHFYVNCQFVQGDFFISLHSVFSISDSFSLIRLPFHTSFTLI